MLPQHYENIGGQIQQSINMRVLHVVESISRTSGGPARSVQGLVAGLGRDGVETCLMTLEAGDPPWVEGVGLFADGQSFEITLSEFRPDIVHLHGLWSLGLHRCAVICRRRGMKYVIAPRGMLEQWSLRQKWLKKRIARILYQDNDLKGAAALHATAENEAEQFRKLGFNNPVIISPNGVNVPKCLEPLSETKSREPSEASPDGMPQAAANTPNTQKRVLFVSRMHPKKGVLELIEACGKVKPVDWQCELVYTVNGDFEREYETQVKARVKELRLEDCFVFTGALNDDEKWKAYARADLFVLPTYSENFGIVVAEALWAGVPVITTKGTPWRELETLKCGWWIDIGVEPLTAALKEAFSLDDAMHREMGSRGHALVEEKYTWDAVVKTMVKGYEGILNGRA